MLAVFVVGAVLNGLRLGAMVQVMSFVGFWIGLAVGVAIALAVARPLSAGVGRITVILALVIGFAAAAGFAGSVLGQWSSVTLKRWHLGSIDAGVGAAIGAISVLVSAWLVAGFLVQTQVGWLSRAVGHSAVLRSVDHVLPPVPSALAEVQNLLSRQGFPSVFAVVVPPVANPSLQPTPGAAAAMAATTVSSVVKVFGAGCGGFVEGSGFVVAPGVVVTNAHVVAGVRAPSIIVGTREYPATAVVVDPGLDLAVLRTKAPLGPPLRFDTRLAPRGTQGAAVGYPENGQLQITAAAISASFNAIGRDIYGAALVTRQVYEISAKILPGDSGGPLVGPGGLVLGVVFSRSTVANGVGYALTSAAVAGPVAKGEASTAAVSTGGCPAG